MISKLGLCEGILFAAPHPVKTTTLAELLELPEADVETMVSEIAVAYLNENHGFELQKIGGGYQFRTKVDLKEIMAKFYAQKAPRLTQPTMEVLSIVAYKQPITRPEIDRIRGVDCTGVLKSLLERDLVEIAGRNEGPGQPVIYRTTQKFLEWFQVASLQELPPLSEVKALDVTAASDGLFGLLERDDGFTADGIQEMDVELNDLTKSARGFQVGFAKEAEFNEETSSPEGQSNQALSSGTESESESPAST